MGRIKLEPMPIIKTKLPNFAYSLMELTPNLEWIACHFKIMIIEIWNSMGTIFCVLCFSHFPCCILLPPNAGSRSEQQMPACHKTYLCYICIGQQQIFYDVLYCQPLGSSMLGIQKEFLTQDTVSYLGRVFQDISPKASVQLMSTLLFLPC